MKFQTFSCILLLFFVSCQAPRNNPLDPQNPGAIAVIEGIVQTLSVPHIPLEGVIIYWISGNEIVKSSREGKFVLEVPNPENGYLLIEKSGFKKDSIYISWNGNLKINQAIYLNSIPEAVILNFSTIVMHQISGNPFYQLKVDASFKDDEKDIDSVFVFNQDLNFYLPLEFNMPDELYTGNFNLQQLGISNLEQLIGVVFNVLVRDSYGDNFWIGNGSPIRVINSDTEIIFPDSNQVTSTLPSFEWKITDHPFSVSRILEVYTNDLANPQLVFHSENLTQTTTQYALQNPVPPGNYFWVIWSYDNFNNSFRSKPGTFIIQ